MISELTGWVGTRSKTDDRRNGARLMAQEPSAEDPAPLLHRVDIFAPQKS